MEARYLFLEARKSPDGTEHWLNWVLRLDTGEAVGTLQATVEQSGLAYVAYMIFVPYWKRGLAQAGMAKMLHLLRESYGVTSFQALVDTRNEPSIRLLERSGFQRTGFRPAADEFKGSVSDEYEYRLELGALPLSYSALNEA